MVDIGRGGNFGSTGDPTSLHLDDEVISVPGGIGGEDGGGNGGNGYSGGGGGGANGYPAGDGGWDGGNVVFTSRENDNFQNKANCSYLKIRELKDLRET